MIPDIVLLYHELYPSDQKIRLPISDTLLSASGAIVLLLIVATILVRRYGWRSSSFMTHVKLENKGSHFNNEEVNHTLIKVEDVST